ncbi:peptidase [Brenneria roseae subsp. roseae]|uniref:TolC family outer membrane protein n=1 Tax=Brenneria roseae TaxID=1509241 RepID=UPI000D62058D|nr:TolC family outer membrane protein [Brenneria roseae]PWC18323.1 peptidase [Brenneria roseae subsp. roseae]
MLCFSRIGVIRRYRLLLCFFTLSYSAPGQALGLMEAWQRALTHDPAFQAAIHARNAGIEEKNIGRAGLLPKVNYDYSQSRNDSTVTSNNLKSERDYNSHASSFSLQQPLLDYEAWSRYQQGEASAVLADEQLRDQSQQLLVRLFQAYSNVLFSREQITLVQAQQRAYREQYQLNQRLYQQGEGTRTDILETEARLNLTDAQLIEAQDNLDISLRELETLLGMPIAAEQLATLTPRFTPRQLQPANYQHWQTLALRHNAQLLALTQSLAVAKYGIERNRAGHLPQITLVASTRNTQSDTESSYNQKYDTRSIGIRVSVPIFAGGGVSAATRQAQERYQQTAREKDEQTAAVQLELRRQFNLVTSSQAKMRAYELAEQSALALVNATRKSVQGGERVNLDVLNAEQQLYGARRDLTEARYTWLTAWLQLRYYAGTLDEQTLHQLSAYFTHAS